MTCAQADRRPWHRCRCWADAVDDDGFDPDDPYADLTREELAAWMISERLEEELAKLPPEQRGTCPPIPPDFLERMTQDILVPDF